MKIFTQDSIMDEVSEGMEHNLYKNAYNQEHTETNHRNNAMQCLVEAAELYKKAGNTDKAKKINDIINGIYKSEKIRSAKIAANISLLESYVDKVKCIEADDINRNFIKSANDKINGLISRVSTASSDINSTIDLLKQSHKLTPKTLDALSEALGVAQNTIKVLAECECEKDKKEDLVKVLQNFGFTLENLDFDTLEADDEDKSWED